MAKTAIRRRLVQLVIMLTALPWAAAAHSSEIPFGDVDQICTQAMPNLAAYSDTFQERGWNVLPLADLSDTVREDLVLAVALSNISGHKPYSKEHFLGSISIWERQMEGLLTLPGYSTLLTAPGTDAQSPLLVMFDPNPPRLKVDCMLAGKSTELDDWITGLFEAKRIRDDFFEFDPSEESLVSEHLSPVNEDHELNISAAINRVSIERAERFLDRPLEYDFLFYVATSFKQEGQDQ